MYRSVDSGCALLKQQFQNFAVAFDLALFLDDQMAAVQRNSFCLLHYMPTVPFLLEKLDGLSWSLF